MVRTGLRALVGLLLLLGLVAGCTAGGTAPAGSADDRSVRRTVADWSAAQLARDEARYLSLDRRPEARAAFGNLAQVPLAAWEYGVLGVKREGSRAFVAAELRYRLAGYDGVAVTSPRELELAERDGRWSVVSDRPGAGAHPQLWDQGPVTAVRGARSLVLGVGQGRGTLEGVAETADRAVPEVTSAWPGKWPERVVVQVPASLDAMAALLGSPAGSYGGMAAVTTSPGDRVTVNPGAYGQLGALGRQVVLTHETVHVATRGATTSHTPLWLSEGFADWVAYRDTGRTPAQVAPALARAVRAGNAPAGLPEAGEFSFAGDGERLARAYESAWLANRMIEQHWGRDKLIAFYEAAATSPQSAFANVLGTDEQAFTADWREYVREQLGGGGSADGDGEGDD
ncbi:hypothetical protein [Streptomyces sp. NPDC101132]|uniref:hypothetical protein n=1 Tax=Streptomyces sp. NPDC101132 TaxID=3366110 RepID=UPI00381283F3